MLMFRATQVCSVECASKGSLYFALKSGSVCMCGDNDGFLAESKEEGICDEPCSGNGTLFCGGGGDDYSLYKLSDGRRW